MFEFTLPKSWKWVNIEDVQADEKRATITGPFGSSIGSKFFVERGIPVIRGNNLTLRSEKFIDNGYVFITEEKSEELKGYKAIANDLLFTAAGTIGQVGIIPEDCAYKFYIISNKQMRVRFNTNLVDPEFAYYWFSSAPMVAYIKAHDTGSTIPLINLGILRKLPMPLPPLYQQILIKNQLSALDQKIHLNTQTNQTLESIAQAIFKSWFVDFEPVKAKIAAKERWYAMQPTSESASPVCYAADAALPDLETYTNLAAICAISGKNEIELAKLQQQNPNQYQQLAATAALFPSAMVDSELGQIPEGWAVKLSGEIMDIRDGTHDSPKQSESGFPLITSKHIVSGTLAIKDAYLISTDDYKKINKRSKVSSGDILLTMIGTVGIPYLVMQKTADFAIKNIGLFKTSSAPMLKNYFYLLIKSIGMQDYLAARMIGTTQKYLSLKTLRSIETLVPSEDILMVFNRIINPITLEIIEGSSQSAQLSELRDSLLPKLLSGEIDLTKISSEGA